MRPKQPPYRNDPAYLAAWIAAVENVTARNPYMAPPPPELAAAHGGPPSCEWCWDTGLCGECLGLYPQYCPSGCANRQGMCNCPAGRARRAAYELSLKDAGLA